MFPLHKNHIFICQLFPMYVPCSRFKTPKTIFCQAAHTCLGQNKEVLLPLQVMVKVFQAFCTLVETVKKSLCPSNKVLIIIVTLVGKGKLVCIHSKDDSQNNLPKPLKHFVMTITMAVDKFLPLPVS